MRRQSWVLVTMCGGVLCAQIDTSVVNLAVHRIGASLHAGMGALQWVLDGYNLTYAVLLLAGGTLGDLFGRRRLFAWGVAVFSVGSLVCGVAPGPAMLIAGRVVAGLGAALLLPCSLAILRVAWPDPVARGRAIGIWASCNGLAFVIGPAVGGLLIDHLGWRSVFLLILPLGVATLLLAWRVVPESADPAGRHFDLRGQISGALALGALALAGIEARSAPAVAILAVAVALAAGAAFVATERREGAAAMVPLAMFRSRPFSGAMAATASMTFGMYGLLFLVPLCWQQAHLLSATGAGLALMPMALAFALISPQSGVLTERLGPRGMTAGGTALIGLGLLTLAGTEAGRPLALAEAGLLLAGIGMGLNTGPLMAVAVGAVAKERAGTAGALINVARMVGATLGVAALGGLFAGMGGGAAGLRAAMLAGGAVQLCGAASAFLGVGGRRAARRVCP